MENQQLTVKSFFERDGIRKKFQELLGKKSQGFITSVLQIVNGNDYLKKATPESIYNAAAMAAVLDLPIQSSLGFAYIVPYGSSAQFQLGYKGFIQLAQRSGRFKNISSTPIYNGQLKSSNPLTGFEFDFDIVPNGDPVGYAAYFSLINGFEKTFYMPVSEIKKHAQRFSKSVNNGPWKTDFDAMAQKTVLKLLLGKYAPLSVEMQQAVIADQSVINDVETMDVTYIDNAPAQIEAPAEPAPEEIESAEIALKLCETLPELKSEWAKIPPHVLAVESVKALKEKLSKEIKK